MAPTDVLQQLDLSGLRPPEILAISITGACNLICSHCWVNAGEISSQTHVPLESLRRLMEEFAAIGGKGIRITGGEPLCHPHLLDILQLSLSLGFKTVILQTNAMFLREEHLAYLSELKFPGFSIQVSLDGASARTHDLVRGEGAFSGAQSGIAKLVQAGLGQNISIFFTEMRHNFGEIPELLDFAVRNGLASVSTGSMVLCGRASETTLVAPPDVEQYLSLLARYDSDVHFRNIYSRIGNVAALQWKAGDAVRLESCTFIENPYLTPSGRLYPCLFCHNDEFSVTGVYEKGLDRALAEGIPLWTSLLRISRSRSEAIPECRNCPGQLLCAGGCMGRAWGSCGNLLAADDRCEVRRAIYRMGGNSPL